jgi:hypothetical protein
VREGAEEVGVSDRTQLDPAFFSIPNSRWAEVGAQSYADLQRASVAIGLALAEIDRVLPDRDRSADGSTAASGDAPSPAELALHLHEVAGALLSRAAADEQSLRQIISTLRTALAVCWDLYSVPESERYTVADHMRNLRTRIEDFEGELLEVQRLKRRPDEQPPLQ